MPAGSRSPCRGRCWTCCARMPRRPVGAGGCGGGRSLPPCSSPSRRGWPAISCAASWRARRGPEPSFVLNAIGAHSVYVPEVRHPVEVKADEEHLVRWLTRRVGAPIRAPSLVDRGLEADGRAPAARPGPAGGAVHVRGRRGPPSHALHPQGDGPQQHRPSSLPSATASARSTGSTGRSPTRWPAGSAARS